MVPLGSMSFFFFSSRRRHTRSLRDWSSDVCSSDLPRRLKPAKHARVPEVNHRVVIKHKPGAAVGLGLSSRAPHEFAGHSQVGEQAAVAVECQQQVLAPAVGLEQLASHLFEEPSICPSENAALLRFGANQLAIAEPLFQIPSLDFYFGQLGHARSLA